MTEKEIMKNRRDLAEKDVVEQPHRNKHLYSPLTDILENGDQYTILVDVPGADREHVQITLEKNVLTIQAETGMQHPEGYTMVLSEYGIGDYTRSFVLTDVIDQEKIEATVTDGVLKLVLPKAGPAKTHQIKISTGN